MSKCPTCHNSNGCPFWGKCEVAMCSINKKLNDCSECGDFPCELLKKYAYDKEQGDNGKRIDNLRELKKAKG
ncbi:DUF3795 domain-containing protein [Candidatus Dojkabacteria bacterium]|nr:DUF3795 domain-containing protein [Candidatus Dojkabacteria bacterium]